MSYERLNLKTGQVITEEVFAHLEEGIEGAANAVLMTPILYADLVALRDAGKLKAGMFYRITDYVTTTVQENTQSAGHAFDVIVMATDSKTLSEEARAIVHEGDTYFTEAGANLAAWKVWYALDNDSARFAWADAENGKGVIYRLIDEWNNDCPYDFKNIQYIGSTIKVDGGYGAQWSFDYELTGNVTYIEGVDYYEWRKYSGPAGGPPLDEIVHTTTPYPTVDSQLYQVSLDDSDNTVAEEMQNYKVIGSRPVIYTLYNTSLDADASLTMPGKSIENMIKPLINYQKRLLNAIVCEDACSYNSFGENCSDIVIANGGSYNSFGNSCTGNSFGNSCTGNSFGNSCTGNSFGDGCSFNSFGNNCIDNSFGDGCTDNSFGNGCTDNSFGNSCTDNSFGDGCSFNSFGNGCSFNSFGNNCIDNSFGNRCVGNRFQNATGAVRPYAKNNSFGNGCSAVALQNDATASESQQIQNYRIANGMSGTVDVTRGLAYETTIAKATDGTIKQFNLADLAN